MIFFHHIKMRRDDEEEKRDCYGFKTNIIRDAIDNREREREILKNNHKIMSGRTEESKLQGLCIIKFLKA